MQSRVVLSFMSFQRGKRGRPPEMGADPLVLEPVGKVRRPIVAVEV